MMNLLFTISLCSFFYLFIISLPSNEIFSNDKTSKKSEILKDNLKYINEF